MPILYDHDHENEVTLFAETNYRNQNRRFGIKTDDRRRHMYLLGKTGMGKTNLLENMVLSDIYAGHGVAYVDPHGDTAEKLLNYIPPKRINDVVYFNPSDMEYPVGFNILETVNDEQKHLVASGLMGVFKKIWPAVWSARMEYILLNCVLALLDYPGATLLGINRLLVDKEYRARVIAKIRDPIVKTFWVAEFSSWSEKYATEAIAPVQNKVGQFLSASIIRNIVAQVKSTINPRQIMDEGKIFIVNLAKGRIGEDNMKLLGGMIITKIQLAAMERVDMAEDERRDFYLFVDEFQNFANQSFANILSEARKYRLSLTVAHQFIEQLEEEVRDAVFGNVGTLIIFRVSGQDATYMETEFMPTYTPEDLTNLAKYQIYLKLMVDGVATAPFSANTLPPIARVMDSEDKVIAVSRERYAQQRAVIEEKVLRWSGMEAGPHLEPPGPDEVAAPAPGSDAIHYPDILTEEEQEARAALGGVPASMKPGTPEYAKAGVAALEGEEAIQDTEEYLRISPERLAAIKPAGGKKDKPKFKHTCTRCGKTWDMPIQLDVSRPMFCAECLPIIREERKFKTNIVKSAVRGGVPGIDAQLVEEAPEPMKRSSGLHETMRAMEEGRPVQRAAPAHSARFDAPRVSSPPPPPNRPRIVVSDREKLTDIMLEEEPADEDHSDLLDDVARTRGRAVETDKRTVVAQAAQASGPAGQQASVQGEWKSGSIDSRRATPFVQDGAQGPSTSARPSSGASSGSKGTAVARAQTDRQPKRFDDRNPRTGNRDPRGPRRPERARGYEVPNRPVIRTGVPSPSVPADANGDVKEKHDRPPKKSIEELFKEIEDREVGERPAGQMARRPAGTDGDDVDVASTDLEHPTTVFRSEPSSVSSGEPPAPIGDAKPSVNGAKPLAPGQRIRFDG
jgi:hypothetical protein